MDGPQPAGSVLAIDHDRLFKELLTTFFAEFLELFFQKLATSLDRDSIKFLTQEHFVNLLDGDAYHADIVVNARFKDTDTFFLIHVEHQSTAPSNFPRRFFRYLRKARFALLSNRDLLARCPEKGSAKRLPC